MLQASDLFSDVAQLSLPETLKKLLLLRIAAARLRIEDREFLTNLLGMSDVVVRRYSVRVGRVFREMTGINVKRLPKCVSADEVVEALGRAKIDATLSSVQVEEKNKLFNARLILIL